MNRIQVNSLWILCAVALCSGCGTPHSTISLGLTRENATSIKTIGVVRPTNPESTQFRHPKAESTAEAFGLLGAPALVAIAAEEKREAKEFEQKVGTPNRNVNEWMGKALEEELSRNGYIVKLIDPPPRKSGQSLGQSLMNDNALPEGLDAILNVAIVSFGFSKEPSRNVFVPWIFAVVGLLSRDGKTTFFRDVIEYGDETQTAWFSIPSDRKFYFRDFDAVVGDPERAVQGLQAAVTAIASRVGQQVKTQGSGIYFFRRGSFDTGSFPLKVEVDGKVVGQLMPKQFLYVPLAPGRHKVRSAQIGFGSSDGLDYATEIELESGKDSYIHTDFNTKSFLKLRIEIVPVPDAEGKKAVAAFR
jgi:hypothetical protein